MLLLFAMAEYGRVFLFVGKFRSLHTMEKGDNCNRNVDHYLAVFVLNLRREHCCITGSD